MAEIILTGDALEQLRHLPPESVHTCVTSPPYYNLRDYGAAGQIGNEASVEEYLQSLVSVFREVRRVLRADGTLWVNMGDSYATRSGSQPPNTRNSYGHTAKHTPRGYKYKDLIGVPWQLAFALRADGWYLRQILYGTNPTVCRRASGIAAPRATNIFFCFPNRNAIISTRRRSANPLHQPRATPGRSAVAVPTPAGGHMTTAPRWSARATGTEKTRQAAGTSGTCGP